MKHIKILLFILPFTIFLSGNALACDVCGCAMAGNYSGIYPQFQKNIIGFRYRFQSFNHPNTDLNLNGTSLVQRDKFQTYELAGRFYLSDRIQLLAAVPYSVHMREESERTTDISGIGDMTVAANYTLINTGDSLKKTFKHTLLVGAGVSLPTGRYQQRDATKAMLPAQFQIGTGAYRFSLRSNYTVRYEGFGVNAEANYTFNGENERFYQFGNQYSASANAFYWFQGNGFSILPSLGISYEHYNQDYEYENVKEQTGGSLQLLNAGIDLYLDKYYVQFFMQQPLAQNLPDAQPSNQGRFSIGVSRVF